MRPVKNAPFMLSNNPPFSYPVKNAPCLLPQKSLACISALALSLQLTEDDVIDSPVSGIKGGS